MTQFKEGDEVLVRATVKDVYANGYFNLQVQANGVEGSDENPLIKLLVQNSENCLIAQNPDLIPASALDVNKELLEACKEAREYFYPAGPTYTRLCEAIASAEKGAIKQPPLSKSAKEARKPPSSAALLDAATEHDVPAKSARTVPVLRAKGT